MGRAEGGTGVGHEWGILGGGRAAGRGGSPSSREGDQGAPPAEGVSEALRVPQSSGGWEGVPLGGVTIPFFLLIPVTEDPKRQKLGRPKKGQD